MRPIIPFVALLLAGCSDNRTVDYFKGHKSELDAVVTACALGHQTGSICTVASTASDEMRAEADKKAAEHTRDLRKKLLGTTGE